MKKVEKAKQNKEISIMVDTLVEFGLVSADNTDADRHAVKCALVKIRCEKYAETNKEPSLYDVIKKLCSERQVSVRYVETTAGLKNGTISKWNDSSPTVKSLKAVADVLKVKLDKLIC